MAVCDYNSLLTQRFAKAVRVRATVYSAQCTLSICIHDFRCVSYRCAVVIIFAGRLYGELSFERFAAGYAVGVHHLRCVRLELLCGLRLLLVMMMLMVMVVGVRLMMLNELVLPLVEQKFEQGNDQ